jgi:hypothetical protein
MKDRDSYRGYYIIKSLSASTWYISKGGHHIGSAASLADAKKVIDELLGSSGAV